MKIYKVRAWVNERTRKGTIEHPFQREEVFLNIKGAMNRFTEMINEVKGYEPYGHVVHVEMFIPHVFEDGSLAYWPDGEKYLGKYPLDEEAQP